MRRIDSYPLWLGHVGDVRDPRGLNAEGIRAVIDLALNESPVVLPRDLVACRFPLVDGPGNPPWLLRAAVETVAALLRARVPTLVYCGAGMSRSPCIAAAAIARIRGCSVAEALALIVKSAPADISPGLWAEVQAEDAELMHALYRQGGEQRQLPPQVIYPEPTCPHVDCGEPMQAIDFRLGDHGRAVHDPLVRAWWNDTGFVGRCPHCGGWIHFTIRTKQAIGADEAAKYPHLPDNWHDRATIL